MVSVVNPDNMEITP